MHSCPQASSHPSLEIKKIRSIQIKNTECIQVILNHQQVRHKIHSYVSYARDMLEFAKLNTFAFRCFLFLHFFPQQNVFLSLYIKHEKEKDCTQVYFCPAILLFSILWYIQYLKPYSWNKVDKLLMSTRNHEGKICSLQQTRGSCQLFLSITYFYVSRTQTTTAFDGYDDHPRLWSWSSLHKDSPLDSNVDPPSKHTLQGSNLRKIPHTDISRFQ